MMNSIKTHREYAMFWTGKNGKNRSRGAGLASRQYKFRNLESLSLEGYTYFHSKGTKNLKA